MSRYLQISLAQVCTVVVLFTTPARLFAQNNRIVVEQHYRGKYVVVLREGLALGLCSERTPGWTGATKPLLTNPIVNGVVNYMYQHGTFLRPATDSPGCVHVVPEPFHKGEVLKVTGDAIVNMYGRRFEFYLTNVSPHSVQRGVGAFDHQSLEQGTAEVVFRLDKKDNTKELIQAATFASEWFAVF